MQQDFVESGGYDEFYYAGYEDQDFTFKMLASGMGDRPPRFALSPPWWHEHDHPLRRSQGGAVSGFCSATTRWAGTHPLLREELLRGLRAHPEIDLAEARDMPTS